ncbi:DUF2867 domain-containing protein [Chryseobacterium sp.]|uniref:DUF2867 domain-containing protein n=1 Tax=Chryseobacterium sp. TaxID=1871047 RepID=UPI0025BAE6F2|nr:DUF2867 domain-containing protein [Chryseobacterium sp.]
MKIRKTIIDKESVVSKYLPANYSDVFECKVPLMDTITPDDLQIAFWGMENGWVRNLFKIRNILVSPFGLKSADNESIYGFIECIKQGGSYNIVSVVDKTPNETVLLLNDSHLKAYLSMRISNEENNLKRITLTTVVHFHNWLGYVYFYTIMPFHFIVVKSMLRNTINQLLNSK